MAETLDLDRCPACGVPVVSPTERLGNDAFRFGCPACGARRFSREAVEDLPGLLVDPNDRAVVSYKLANMDPEILVTRELATSIAKRNELPSPLGRIDLLLALLAEDPKEGIGVQLNLARVYARIGCRNAGGAKWALRQATAMGYVESDMQLYSLTAKGWERYAEMTRQGHGSTHAFMAMQFGDAELDRVYRDYLVPAVAATGFRLRTVNGPHQTAGSIDNRMRVEIRTSRFLVCDLTHGNRGAYWEAGFAEGLGRPVFYVCHADVLANRQHPNHPHFDTRQQLIITWHPADPAPGMQALKDAIRATLPDLARMED